MRARTVAALLGTLLVALSWTAAPAHAASESTRIPLALDRSIVGSSTATWDERQGTLRQDRAHAGARFTTPVDTLIDPTPEANQFCGGRSGQNADAVAIGRINADALPDLVVGCPLNDSPSPLDSGSVLVFIRASDNSGWLTGVELFNPNKASAGDAECGRAVAIGDLNGDGKGDVAMGCPQRDTPGDRGSAVTFLRNAGDTSFDPGVEHSAPTPVGAEFCGHSVAIGNISGVAGQGDLLFGCVGTSTYRGRIAAVHWNGASFDAATAFTYGSVLANDWCGASVVLGDINGDTRSDLVYGCSGNNGRAVARLASGAMFGTEMALNHPTPASGDQCGFKVLIADLDGDGDGDVVSSCNQDDPAGRTNQGSAFAYTFASGAFGAGDNLVPSGANTGELCGSSIGVGDINGDSRSDVVLGCPGATSGGQGTAGNVNVILRNEDGSAWDAGVYRQHPYPYTADLCAFSLAVGDVDGDGFDDIAQGCPQIDDGGTNAGGVMIGAGAGPSWTAMPTGTSSLDNCGTAVAAGDFNGDGLSDTIIGCPGDTSSRGSVSVGFASEGRGGFAGYDRLQPAGSVASDECGRAVAAADVNGDGRDDVLMGCPGRDATVTDRGVVFVYTRNAANNGFDTGVAIPIPGGAANDNCGLAVAGADIDGDGNADVVTGCPFDNTGSSDAGAIYVSRRNGNNNGFDVPDRYGLPATAPSDACGRSLAAGDLDADGRADVVMGCSGDDDAAADAGSIGVFMSTTTGLASPTILTSTTANASGACGVNVAVGDTDGNGEGDVAAGCVGDNGVGAGSGVANMGSAVVWRRTGGVYGASTELDHAAPAANDDCGRGVEFADVNGDGRDDVLVGCTNDDLASPAVSDGGSVQVFTRNAANSGFDAAVHAQDKSPAATDNCGMAVSAGDINGDGRSDLQFGCPGDDEVSNGGALALRTSTGSNLTGSVSRVLVTKRLNLVEPSRVTAATLSATSHDNGTPGAILELSVDGGSTWEAATLGVQKTFVANGNDLRMRLTLPANSNRLHQRLIHDLTLDYTWSTPTAGTISNRVPLGLDRSDIAASTAIWDEKQRALRQTRAHAPARMSTEIVKQRGTPGSTQYCGWSTEIGNFNGDGLPDLVIGCAANNLSSLHAIVYMRNATGYDAPVELVNPTPAANDTCAYSIDTGDVTGDGLDDVVMGCVGADAVTPTRTDAGSAVLFVNNGSGFNAGIEYFHATVLGNDQCGYAIALGDVNGDARADLVQGCVLTDNGVTNAGAAVVQLSTGSGFSATATVLANPTPVANGTSGEQCGASVDVGDVNGDTFGDVVMGCRYENSTVAGAGSYVVYRGSAGGTFTYEGEYFAPTRAASEQCGEMVRTADFDGNGRADVVFTCPQSNAGGSLSGRTVIRNRNAANTGFDVGTVSSAFKVGDECGGWRGLAAGDVDGNGRPDVMVGCNASNSMGSNSGAAYVHVLNAAGTAIDDTVEMRSNLQTAGDQCGLSVAISADATGDGRPDVYVGCPADSTTAGSAGSVVVLDGLASSQQLLNPTPGSNDGCGMALASGDVNGDGLVDLVTGCSINSTGGGGSQTVLVQVRNPSNTGYLTHVELSHPAPATDDLCGLAVAVDDVNGDGRDDILGGCAYDDTGAVNAGSAVLWLRNAANSGFRSGIEYSNPTPNANAFCGGNLTAGNAVALGDINGDGRADMAYGCQGQTVAGNSNSGAVVVRVRNAANSGFDAPITLPNPSPNPGELCGTSVAIGDLDGDGYGDVVAGCPGSNSNAGSFGVWTWDAVGLAFVARAEQYPSSMAFNEYCGRSLDIGDVDGNGLGDVAVGCTGDQVGATTNVGSAQVFVRDVPNTGFLSSVQVSRPTLASGSGCGYGLSLGDVNGDGRDDVGIGCPQATSSQGVGVVGTRNAANTAFDASIEQASATAAASDQCGVSMIIADIDRDGRSDMVLGCPLDDDGASSAGTTQTFGSTSTGSAGGVTRLVETKRLNRGTMGTVTAATIGQLHTANGAAAPTLQASADGGSNWQAAAWGAPISFTNAGDDLRLRVSLPASSNQKFVEVLHSLSVSYDYVDNAAPGAPTHVTPAAAGHVTDDTPALTATFVDANAPDTGTLQFQVCTVTVAPAQTCASQGGTQSATGSTAAGIANGANGTWSPASSLAADSTYYWRARARDNSGVWGPWSASTSVIVDSVITVGPASSTIPLGAVALGADVVGSTTITVGSNDPQGYQLVAADQDAAWGMQCSNVPVCASSTIPDRTATGAAPLTWGAGVAGTSGYTGVTVRDTTGVSTNRLAKWGTANTAGWPATDFGNNLFVGLGTTTTVLHQVAAVAPADTVDLVARVTAGGSTTPTPAGSYAGTITVTAVGL